MVRHEETCDRAEQDDLCMFARDDGKRTRGLERDSRNPCDMQQQRCWCQLAGREKRKDFAYGDESALPAPSQTLAMARSGRFPRKSELAPHTHGSDSG
jgi:hypothetical protein